MGSFCTSGNTVNQTQTYRPNPQAASAITGALGQAQQVAQTPFQTPVAPVAGFSGQQNQAFNLANGIPGAAMPYIQEGADYLRGQGTENFYNPMSANVLAGLKDIFGQQMSDTTGKLQNAAGGAGASRIAVGQSELAKEQGLSAGQTLANLWQQAQSAAQNAGYGLANMGNLAQNSQMQGLNALLTTGGLQQQQQQAQLNAPYQNELQRIQWPYQNSQFLTQATGALAPGLGGTTSGNTQYPQQSPFGTIAGLGMAGAGLYGYGNSNGWWDGSGGNSAAGKGVGGVSVARGGRIYADGGAVDDNMLDAERGHDWEIPGGHPINVMEHSLIPQGQITPIQPHIPQLQAPQQQSGGGLGDLAGMAMKVLPMILAAQTGGRVPSYADGGPVPPQPAPGQPQMPFGQMANAMNQSGNPLAQAFGGMFGAIPQGGGMPQGGNPFMSALSGMFNQAHPGGGMPQPSWPGAQGMLPQGGQNPMQILAALRSRFGGQGQPQQHFADGGAVDEDPGLEGLRRATEAMDITRMLGAGPSKDGKPPMLDWTMALMGLRPSGIGINMGANGLPRTQQIRGQFQRLGTPITNHPAQQFGPAYLGINAASNQPLRASRFFEDPEQGGMGKGMGPEEPPASFNERFGFPGGGGETGKEMASEEPPAAPERAENPFAPEPVERVPLPRAVVRTPQKKKRVAEIIDVRPSRPTQPFIGHRSGFADGGEVEDEAQFEEPVSPFTRRQAQLEEASPFERAALRTRESVRPTSGRKEGPLMGAAGTALAIMGSPEAAMATYAPRLGGALYGLAGGMTPSEAGNEFQWTDANKQRLDRLNTIDKEIALESSRSTKSAPGTQAKRIDSLNAEKQFLLSAQDKDKNLARQDWENAQQLEADRLAEKKKQETSFFDVIPGTRAALTAASPFASYVGGKYLGKRLGPWASIPVGATTGALEGAASIGLPTEVDINSLPESSPTRQQAQASLSDPEYYKRLGLASAASGAFGALGAIKGYASTRPVRKPPAAPPPSSLNGATPPPAAPPKTRVTYTDPRDPNKVIGTYYPHLGQWRVNGQWAKKTDYPDPKKFKAGAPEHYATGGSVDFEDQWDPTTKAIQDGTFDPQGDNFPSGIAPFARGRPMPRANPFREDPYVAQAAAEPPPAAGPIPRQGLLQNATNEAPRSQGLADNPWMALLNAGLGTMASAGQRDARGLPMSPMAAIGHGGQQGLKTLETQREAAMKQQSLEQAAKRLQQQAQHQIDQLEETKRHNTETEKARKEGLAAGKWKVIGPTADGEGVIQMDSETGEHRILPVKMGQKAKPLPTTAGNKLEKYGQTHATVSSLGSEFKDEYSGYGLKGVGDSANWAARQLGIGNEKAANWWQQHARYTNEVRHGLFGAALTGHESSEWEKSDVNPGTQPSVVKENLARQKEIVLGAMGRKALSLKEDGYNPKAIEAQMGVSFATLEKAAKQADAIEWARNNRGDPRAKQILQMHGRE